MAMMVRNFQWLPIRVAGAVKKAFGFGLQSMNLTAIRALFLMPRNNRYDIIHCQFGTLGPVVITLKTIGGIDGKLVTSFRGYDATKVIDHNPDIYDQLFKEGNLFLPVSNSLKKRIIKAGCRTERIRVHHSGIDCSKFIATGPKFPEDVPFKLLTIARLVEKKGISYAIQAIAELKRCNHRVVYTVIGEGYLRPDLEKLIEDLGLMDEVKLIGWQTHEVVIQLLQQSHILIAPSVTINGNQEGIPNALKEAMAMGLPVIGTLHGGIPELIEDGVSGFLVPERDVKALAERLTFLIEHPEVWQEFGRRGSKNIRENYDIGALNDSLVRCYQKLLDHQSPSK
jgi:colanic acid/amylovoran biosynthesis glycosyltransferase